MRRALPFARTAALAISLLACHLLPTQAVAQHVLDASVLAGSCANCHGTDGRSPGVIPTIAGRPETVLLQQLQAFKSDTPPANTTVMNRLVKGFSDEELILLAQHFSKISAQEKK